MFFFSIPQIFLNALRFQQGLYGSVVGSILYTFLGTCKEISMGPTAIVSLMTYNTLRGLGPVYGTILCFLSGFIQVTTGLMGLGKQRRLVVVNRSNSDRNNIWFLLADARAAGFLIDFISGPVNSGFVSAVAVLIVLSQVKDLVGIKSSGTTVPDIVASILENIPDYRPVDACLGIVCIVVILVLRVSVYRTKPFCPSRFYRTAILQGDRNASDRSGGRRRTEQISRDCVPVHVGGGRV